MIKQTDSRFLDTSVWLSYYLAESETAKTAIESEHMLFTSVLSLFELRRKLLKMQYTTEQIDGFVDFVINRATIAGISPDTASMAAELSVKHVLGAMDALLLASARSSGHTFLTFDKDFKNLKDVEVIR